MGLLGDSFDDPRTSAIMALSGGLLSGNFGAGLVGANQAYAQAQNDAAKRKYMDMQVQDMAQQAELRKQQAAQLQRQQEMQNAFLFGGGLPGAGGAPAAPSGGMGAAPAAPQGAGYIQPQGGAGGLIQQARQMGIPEQAIQADVAFNGGKGLSDMLFKRGTPNVEFINGVAVDKNRVMPGASLPQMSPTGQGYQIMPDPSAPGGFRVIMPQGADEVYGRFKAIDAGINAQMTPEKVFNPATQREEFRTRAQVLQGANTPQQVPPAQGGVQGNFAGNPEPIIAAIQGIKDPQERANALAAFQEQAKRTPGFAQGGAFAAGPSSGEANAAAAEKEQLVQSAKDVAEQRKGIMNAGFVAPTNIARYQQIGKLLQDVDGGALTATGTHLASLANSLGVKIDKNLPNKEAAASLANAAALELRNPSGGAGMPGALSDADRNFLASMTPNMSQSAQGRKQVIDAYIAVQTRNQQVAQFARKYEQKYGKLDNGFFDQLSAWSSANPLFKGQ